MSLNRTPRPIPPILYLSGGFCHPDAADPGPAGDDVVDRHGGREINIDFSALFRYPDPVLLNGGPRDSNQNPL